MSIYFPILIVIGLAILAWYLFNTKYSDVHEIFEQLAERHEGKVQKTAPFTFPKLFLSHQESTLIVTVNKEKKTGIKKTVAQYLLPKELEEFRVFSRNSKNGMDSASHFSNFDECFKIEASENVRLTFLNPMLTSKVRKLLCICASDIDVEMTVTRAFVGIAKDGSEVTNPCLQMSYSTVLADELDYEEFIQCARILADQANKVIDEV